jgi:hypothetical protein
MFGFDFRQAQPLVNLSTWSKPILKSSRCRRKTMRLNSYLKGNFWFMFNYHCSNIGKLVSATAFADIGRKSGLTLNSII